MPFIKDKHFFREEFKEEVVGQHRLSFYHSVPRKPGDRSGLKSTLARPLPISSCADPNSISDAQLATAALDARARSSESFLMARDIPVPNSLSVIKLGELETPSDMLDYSMKPTAGKNTLFIYLLITKLLYISDN